MGILRYFPEQTQQTLPQERSQALEFSEMFLEQMPELFFPFPVEHKFLRELLVGKEHTALIPAADTDGKVPSNVLPEYKNLRSG